MKRFHLFLTLCLLQALGAAAQQTAEVVRAEYFFDTDPGYGLGLDAGAVSAGENSLTLQTTDLTDGVHLMGLRVQDSQGRWSPVRSQLVYIVTPKGQVAGAEYFFDTDPGHGLATPAAGIAEGTNMLTLQTSSLTEGVHLMGFRVCDSRGLWSQTTQHIVYVAEEGVSVAKAEYFLDADPGVGNGRAIPASGKSFSFALPTDDLAAGEHTLYVRLLVGGQWQMASHLFVVTVRSARLEYFFDTDPGYGLGLQENVVEGVNMLTLDTSSLSDGVHLMGMRVLDLNGLWSQTSSRLLYVCQPMSEAVAAEYFFDTDPGHGRATQIHGIGEGSNSLVLPTDGLAEGVHRLGIRVSDATGRWSTVASQIVYISPAATSQVTGAEYFVDTDPGCGLATRLDTDGGNSLQFALATDQLSLGDHLLCVRLQVDGQWLTAYSQPFTVVDTDSGVASIEFSPEVSIERRGSELRIERPNPVGAMAVTIATPAGVLLASATLSDGESLYVHPLGNEPLLIVRCQDTTTGKAVVRTISLR